MASAQRLPLRHALALGLLQGPTELLPVSSSAHITLLPWLAGWPYGELEPRLRKSFEVALHAGTAAALLVQAPRDESEERCREGDSASVAADTGGALARLGFLAAAVGPPAFAGYAFGTQIERRLGTPATIAAGLLAGSVAMGAGELRASAERAARSASVGDGLAFGVAQALALIPGVSRSGATLAAARARGFSRAGADRLSWRVGLPVIAGAAALKGSRLVREGVPRELAASLAVGAASAFVSTLVSTRALSPKRRGALLPACAVYRAALALLVVVRTMRDDTKRARGRISKKINTSH